MAKQSVNLVERHLEKAILGVGAVVLIAAVVMFLVSSPNKIELGADLVGPSEIDDRALDAANQLRDRLNNVRPDTEEVPPFVGPFEAALSPLAYAEVPSVLPVSVPWLPPVPDVIDEVPVEGEIRLAEVIKPGVLRVMIGRSTVVIEPPVEFGSGSVSSVGDSSGALGQRTDVNWVTVGCLFDQKEQIAVHQQAGYKAGRQNPYLLGMDLQRREKKADGAYDVWQDVPAYRPVVLPKPPEVDLVAGPSNTLIASRETENALRDFFGLLKAAQAEVFRPLFPEVLFGSEWLYPKYRDVDDLRVEDLDWELCRLTGLEKCDEVRGYPRQSDIAPVEEEKTGVALVEATLEEAQRYFDRGDWERAIATAVEARDMAEAGKQQVDRAAKLIFDAEQRQRDELRRGPGQGQQGGDDDEREHRKSRYQIAWSHDLADTLGGGAESGKTYQYRARFRLYNRFCGVPAELADAEEARKVGVVGAWSDPTVDVRIPTDVAMFVTHGTAQLGTGAKATVFKWFEGIWVSETFDLEIGEPIGRRERTGGRSLPGGGRDRPLVDFSTGARVVDVEYDYEFRRRKSRGAGFELESPRRTIALMYVGPDGALRQQVMEVDRYGASLKRFRALVDATP
jgi:hypothetical protein